MCGVLGIVLGFLLLWKISDNAVQVYQLHLQGKLSMRERSEEEEDEEVGFAPEEREIGFESVPVQAIEVEEE